MQLNTLFKNVFDPSQIEYLKNLPSVYTDISPCPERGRKDIFIGPDIREDIKNTVLSYFDNNYELYHVTWSEYSSEHGIPNLPSHTDPKSDETSLTFDYQLEANINWPMCAEGKCHDMEDNDALIFDPQNMDHQRPDLKFKPDDYVRVLFFFLKKA